MNAYLKNRMETLKQYGINKVEMDFCQIGDETWYILYWNGHFVDEWQGSDMHCKAIGEDDILIATILGEDSLEEFQSGIRYESEALLFHEVKLIKRFKYTV